MDCLIFETERTYIRQMQDADFGDYFRLESNPEVMQYITGRPRDREEARLRFAKQRLTYLREPGFGVWVVCLKGSQQLIGTVCLTDIPDTTIRQVGYKLTPAQQGKGLATELTIGLIAYGFECCGLSEASAVCNPLNKASEKVMQKAGMAYVGKNYFYDSECLHYRIDSATWFQRKNQSCSFTAKTTNT